jgi:hypothetical protein
VVRVHLFPQKLFFLNRRRYIETWLHRVISTTSETSQAPLQTRLFCDLLGEETEVIAERMGKAIARFKESHRDGRVVTVGQALQYLGTDCVRDVVSKRFWLALQEIKLNNLCARIGRWLSPKPCMFIYTDMRFPEEMQFIRTYAPAKRSVLLRIVRPAAVVQDGRDASHPSETSLDGASFANVIQNNGSIEELHERTLACFL